MRVKGVRSFLGIANFYCLFISKYAEVAQPLMELTRKNMVFMWGKAQQEAFNLLKEEFMKEPTLTFANLEKPLRVEADASKFTVGEALCVKTEKG